MKKRQPKKPKIEFADSEEEAEYMLKKDPFSDDFDVLEFVSILMLNLDLAEILDSDKATRLSVGGTVPKPKVKVPSVGAQRLDECRLQYQQILKVEDLTK